MKRICQITINCDARNFEWEKEKVSLKQSRCKQLINRDQEQNTTPFDCHLIT